MQSLLKKIDAENRRGGAASLDHAIEFGLKELLVDANADKWLIVLSDM